MALGPSALAAKKYYPPGFTPPSDTTLLPTTKPVVKQTPPPQIQIIETPGQTIIKTVQVQVPVKPKQVDPLTSLIDDQRFTEALRLVEQRLKSHPGDTNLRLTHADLLRQKGSFEAAENEFRGLTRNRATAVRIRALIGLGHTLSDRAQIQKRSGQETAASAMFQQAQNAYRQALKLDSTQATAWSGLADIYLVEKKYQEAQVNSAKASRLLPNNTTVLLTQAKVYIAMDRSALALPLLFKAKQQAGHSYVPTLLLGQAYLAMNRYDDAIIQLQQALEIVPDNTDALKSLSQAYALKLKPDAAESALQKAVSLNPNDIDATRSLLKVYDDADENERALLLLKTQLKQSPQQVVYQQALLERLARTGQWDEVYHTGEVYLLPLLADIEKNRTVIDAMMVPFSHAAYLQGKGLLDRRNFLTRPIIQSVMVYNKSVLEQMPASLRSQRAVLLLDPLANLPVNTATTDITDDVLPAWVEVTYLKADRLQHRAALARITAPEAGIGAARYLEIAERLLLLGDYPGARQLASAIPKAPQTDDKVAHLMDRIAERERLSNRYLQDLLAMTTKIPRATWQGTAEEALRASGGNWRVHATLADNLIDRKDWEAALMQEAMAARFAPTLEERDRWIKKAEKTRQKIKRR